MDAIGAEAYGLFAEMFREQVLVQTWPEERSAPTSPGEKSRSGTVTMISRRPDIGAIAATLQALEVSEPRETLRLVLACFRVEREGAVDPLPTWMLERDADDPDWLDRLRESLGELEE